MLHTDSTSIPLTDPDLSSTAPTKGKAEKDSSRRSMLKNVTTAKFEQNSHFNFNYQLHSLPCDKVTDVDQVDTTLHVAEQE